MYIFIKPQYILVFHFCTLYLQAIKSLPGGENCTDYFYSTSDPKCPAYVNLFTFSLQAEDGGRGIPWEAGSALLNPYVVLEIISVSSDPLQSRVLQSVGSYCVQMERLLLKYLWHVTRDTKLIVKLEFLSRDLLSTRKFLVVFSKSKKAENHCLAGN